MRRLLLSLLLVCPAVQSVEIYRCEDRHGRQVFSDQPCRAIGALPLPSQRDQPLALPPQPGDLGDPAQPADPDPAQLEPPAAAAGCPGPTAEALGEALIAAAGRGDLNAISGMYHWPSAGRGAATRVFAEARRLSMAAPLAFQLVDARIDDSWLWTGQPPPDQPRQLPAELLLTPADDPDVLLARFPLVAHAGCFWLSP